MARYFFDLINGEGLVRDEEGQEMPGRTNISQEASRILADVAREDLPAGGNGTILIKVRDDRGRPVFTACLSFETQWHDQENSQVPARPEA